MENKEVENVEVKEEVQTPAQDEIEFHDSTPAVAEQPKNGKNKLAIVALVLVVIGGILGFIPSTSTILGMICLVCSLGGFISSIVSLVQIKKKNQEGKIFGVLGIVLSIVFFIVSLIIGAVQIANMPEEELNDLIYCPYATECKEDEKNKGKSICAYVDGSEVTCTTELLKDDQFE